ncbi:predicted protein [Enterococcus faecalis Merz96]|nr:predicted protein [Enterococcus faecalis Merz96]
MLKANDSCNFSHFSKSKIFFNSTVIRQSFNLKFKNHNILLFHKIILSFFCKKTIPKVQCFFDESVLYYVCKQNIGGYQHEKSIDFTNEICSRGR